MHDLCSGKGDEFYTSQQGMTSRYSKRNDDGLSSSSNYSTTDSSQLTTTSYQPSYHKLFTKPFAPRSSSDILLGMEVLFTRSRGWLSRGKVKYIGSFPGRHETYIGIELGSGEGKCWAPCCCIIIFLFSFKYPLLPGCLVLGKSYFFNSDGSNGIRTRDPLPASYRGHASEC